ncbi:hypothetical protein [Oceanobacillus sp. CF4.6]|uniref:hypothetical protein n=1 Tax=Oceanobacillus sp. CF4.6 TaxID=3373080 RepID=UPI003EE70765
MAFATLFKIELRKIFKMITVNSLIPFLGFFLSSLILIHSWDMFPILILFLMWLVPISNAFVFILLPISKSKEVWIKPSTNISQVFLSRFFAILLNFILLLVITILLINLFIFIYPNAQETILNGLGKSLDTFWLQFIMIALMLIVATIIMLTSAAYGAIKEWGPHKKRIYFLLLFIPIELLLLILSSQDFLFYVFVIPFHVIAIVILVLVGAILLRRKNS